MEVDRAAERQIFELTNSYRKKHGVSELKMIIGLRVARQNSKDWRLEIIFRMNLSEPANLTDRLKVAIIEHRKAGENIALIMSMQLKQFMVGLIPPHTAMCYLIRTLHISGQVLTESIIHKI